MSRISTYATSLTLNQYMLNTQERTFRAQEQLTSGFVSQNYSHIALQTQQLIYNEATRSRMETYVKDNETADLRMQIQSDTLGGITSTIDDFRKTLRDFDVTNASETETDYIQGWAFRTMRDLQSYLNTQSDGRYMFSGSKINTPSVDLQLTTLSDFQARYDGYINEYPSTRDAHLARASLTTNSLNDASATITPDNWLRFNQDSDGDAWTSSDSSIVATPGMFSNLTAGATIQIGSTSSNDGQQTVKSVASDGSSITLVTEMLTDETLVDTLVGEALTGAHAGTVTLSDGTILSDAEMGDLTLVTGADTVTAATGGAFAAISNGDTIQIGGTAADDGTYIVADVTGDVLTLTPNTAATVTDTDGNILTVSDFGDLGFDRSTDTITAETANAFSAIAVGSVFTVAGTTQNDGTYTVASNDGTNLEIVANYLTDEGTASGSTYYDYTVGQQTVIDDSAGTISVQDYTGTAIASALDGVQVGDSITLANTTAYDGSYTVSAVSSDGSQVTVTGLPASGVETDEDGTDITIAARSIAVSTGNEFVFDDNGAAGGGDDTIQLRNIGTSAADANALVGVTAGQTIEISGSTGYDGTYLISAVDEATGTLTIDSSTPLDTAGVADVVTPVSPAIMSMKIYSTSGTINTDLNYYQGDEVSITHRVKSDRVVDYAVTAIDTVFEKAIRALGIFAQGVHGTEGGLDQNATRRTDVLWLLDDVLGRELITPAPYGTEQEGDIETMLKNLTFEQLVVKRTNEQNNKFMVFLEGRIADTEIIDQLEVITRLMDDTRSLEASYQAIARVSTLSLSNFLPM